MPSKRRLSLALIAILLISIVGAAIPSSRASAAHPTGTLLFSAVGSRDVTAGGTQKIWVHTMALADVALKVAYGDGQMVTLQGQTDSAGVHQFQWMVDYTGASVSLARYWLYVTRGNRATQARGDFVLYPLPPLGVRLDVLTPSLHVGETLRLSVRSRPGATLTLHVSGTRGQDLLIVPGRADKLGRWLVSVPVSATITRDTRLGVTVTAKDLLGRHTSAISAFLLKPQLAPWQLDATGHPIPMAHLTSFSDALATARKSADGSLSVAQSNARLAVQAIVVDLQVVTQFTAVGGPQPYSYYQDLLAKAVTYDDYITATARALADDAIVQARMSAVMPPKAIMVSIGEQALRAYENGRMVLFTYVTTGRPELPTVTGHFYIYEKVTPFEFHSPWPLGSPFYYPPTWIKYWMPFTGGYGLHDAWWRAHYGPGTNIYGDGPGSGEPTGTHGCVNIPFAATQWIWDWAPVGTPVVVYGGPYVAPGLGGI